MNSSLLANGYESIDSARPLNHYLLAVTNWDDATKEVEKTTQRGALRSVLLILLW